MKRFTGLIFLLAAAFTIAALAAPKQQHLRGTITSFNSHRLVLHSRDGQTVRVALNSDTKYAGVVKSSLAEVKKNDYIGTATKQRDGKMVALEVVIFPEAMRGMGEGHYGWDKLPDTTGRGAKPVASSMTNGNVKSSTPGASHERVRSSMTNGSVTSSKSTSGAKRITVAYKGGEKHITVPPSAPVVSLRVADRSTLKKGAQTFIIARRDDKQLTAHFVAVGRNGVKPPM